MEERDLTDRVKRGGNGELRWEEGEASLARSFPGGISDV